MAGGIAALVAAPYMVAVAAPAGLAGGAGIVAGLAALGPGGMAGGLGMVGLVGGAGGAAIAGGLTAGSAGMVEEKVIYLQALALAEQKLHEQHHRAKVWGVLVEMETTLAAEHARLARHSDAKARIVKELGAKSASVEKAIRGLRSAGLGPRAPGTRGGRPLGQRRTNSAPWTTRCVSPGALASPTAASGGR